MRKIFIAVALLVLLANVVFARGSTYYTVISFKGDVLAETQSGEPIDLRVGKMLASNGYISVGAGSSLEISAHGKIVTFLEGTVGALEDLMERTEPPKDKIQRTVLEKAVQAKEGQ